MEKIYCFFYRRKFDKSKNTIKQERYLLADFKIFASVFRKKFKNLIKENFAEQTINKYLPAVCPQ